MNDNRSTNGRSAGDGMGVGGSDLSPTEELLLMKVGVIVAGAVASSVFTVAFWRRILDWLVEHQVLVAASGSPIVKMPAGQGVGLDLPRAAVAVAAGVALAAFGVAALRAYWSRSDELAERRLR
jgi:hypothetical protein